MIVVFPVHTHLLFSYGTRFGTEPISEWLYLPTLIDMNRTEQMVYLKISVDNNAHEDTQHIILFTNMAVDSIV